MGFLTDEWEMVRLATWDEVDSELVADPAAFEVGVSAFETLGFDFVDALFPWAMSAMAEGASSLPA
jgi:hypothetical protein